MIWAIDLDDFRGDCGKKHALLQVMNEKLKGYVVKVDRESSTTPKPKPNWDSGQWNPNSGGGNGGTSSTTTTTQRPSTTTSKPPMTSSSPSSSSTPCTCGEGGSTSTTPCPSTPSGDNHSSSTPSPPNQPTPPTKESDMCTDPSINYIPNQNDCSAYYWCVHGKPLTAKCPPGTMWDTNGIRCDWPDNVKRTDCQRLSRDVE